MRERGWRARLDRRSSAQVRPVRDTRRAARRKSSVRGKGMPFARPGGGWEEDDASGAGRFPVRRGMAFADGPRASSHARLADGPTAPADRRALVRGWRDGKSGLAVTRALLDNPASSGPSRRRCLVQPLSGRDARHRRAPRPLWAWLPRRTRTSPRTSGDPSWWGLSVRDDHGPVLRWVPEPVALTRDL